MVKGSTLAGDRQIQEGDLPIVSGSNWQGLDRKDVSLEVELEGGVKEIAGVGEAKI